MKAKNYKKLLALTIASVVAASNPINSKAKESNIIDEILEHETYVKAIDTVNVRKYPSLDSKIVGKVKTGEMIRLYEDLNNGWMEVEYNGTISYVSKEYVKVVEKYQEKEGDLKLAAVVNDTILFTDNEDINIEKNEVVEIINDSLRGYYVDYNDTKGYINKNDVERLNGTFVIVDISDQELTLYENNNIILTTPVVTGLPTKDRETNTGLYSIYDITYNRALVDAKRTYSSYVDVMMKFNKNQGLHDAEYHTDYDKNGKVKKSHGWRNYSEFGGDTYLKNGSHGCVNMPHDAAIEVSDHISLGDKVLVKK